MPNVSLHLVLILYLLSYNSLFAQTENFQLTHYTLAEGLPQSMVTAIFQDEVGIIWVGTGNGLAFFDGKQFKSVDPFDPDSSGVSNLLIERGHATTEDRFLLHYENYGWKYFDPITRSFQTNTINQFSIPIGEGPFVYAYDDQKGRTWTQTTSAKTYVISADRTNAVYLSEKPLIEPGYVYGVTSQPKSDQIYLVAEKGIYVFNENETSFRLIPHQIPVGFFFYRNNYPMEWLDDETLVVGLPGKLLWFHPGNESFQETSLPEVNGKADDQSVRQIVSDRQGGFFFEVNKRIYHQTSEGKTNLVWESTVNSQLEVDVRCMLLDKTGVLWFGTNANGLYKLNLNAFPISNHTYQNNFHMDVLSSLEGFDALKLPKFWKEGRWSYDFRWAYDNNKNLYAAFSNLGAKGTRLIKFDGNKWMTLRGLEDLDEMIAGLVTSGDTIFAMHREGGLYTWVHADSLPTFTHLSPKNVLNELVGIHRYKNYWLTLEMRSGIRIFKDEKPHQVFNISGLNHSLPVKVNRFTCILAKAEEPSRVYLGTYGNGIIEWDVENGYIGLALPGDQLEGAVLFAMAYDDYNRIWLTTSSGIKLFYPKSGKLVDLSGLDGMPGFEFNRFHIFKFPNGAMAFGGMEGWLDLPANDFGVAQNSIDIAFTNCFVNGEARRQSAVVSNYIPLNTNTPIEFTHSENYLRFEFTGTDYGAGELEYRYKLEHFDKQWNAGGTVGNANFSNLPPGNYRLLVQSRISGNEWKQNESGILEFKIHPPFWASWYAYALYFLLGISGILLLWRNRKNKLKLKYNLAEESMKTRQLEELDGLKTKFIDNITHELRTPLTLIHSPITALESTPDLSSDTKKSIDLVKRHSLRLIELVNQMLDLSKIQVGAMKEHLSLGDLPAFVSELIIPFEIQAKDQGKLLESVIMLDHRLHLFDKEKWSRILQNLLSNALKHTLRDDVIQIKLMGDGKNCLELMVTDNGEGISADQLPHIFERFYQAYNAQNKEGTGIGLSLVKELIELMEGSIRVESALGKGTQFIIKLPIHLPAAAPEIADRVSVENDMSPTIAFDKSQDNELPLILLVEDNEDLNNFIATSLSQKFRVLRAHGGEDGLSIAKMELPDLVITDWMMPGMDGTQLCEALKKDVLTRHIAVILLTAKSAVESRLQGLASGADDYLAKPFVWDELLFKIQNQLRQKENLKLHLQKELLPNTPPEQVAETTDPFLREVYHVLESKYKDPLEVNTLAEIMHLHRRTLHRKIMALLGIGPNELIKQFRLQKACSMLSLGASASEAGYACGFESPSYFSKCFKEQYGISPSEFHNP